MRKWSKSMVLAFVSLPMFACGDSTAERLSADDEVGEGVSGESAGESADDGSESGTQGADERADTLGDDGADGSIVETDGAGSTGDGDGGSTGDGESMGDGDMTTGDGDMTTADASTGDGDMSTDDGDMTTGDGDMTTADASTGDGDTSMDGSEAVDEQCLKPYLILDLADRNEAFNDGDGNVEWCDRQVGNSVDPQWGGPNWYRFMGAAGTHMPEFPPSPQSCGTEAPGWLLGDHPAMGEGVVPRTVCFAWIGDSCQWDADIEVVDCGDFYLYNLANTSTCALRYCGTD